MKAEEFIKEGKKDRKDKRHTIKPKTPNPVAKHAMSTIGGGGFGAHKDKKKAAKQGDVKHKNKEMSEGAEFGAYYYEKLAQQVFDANPNLNDEDAILNAGYAIAKKEMGSRAQGIFRDEDFPSDFVSAYGYLKKQGVAEDDVFEYETHTYKDSQGNVWRVNDEGDKELISAAPGGGYGGGSRYGSRYPRKPAYNKPKGYYFYNVPAGKEDDARAAGLRQSKSGKWFDTMTNFNAEKIFGKGRWWEPKN